MRQQSPPDLVHVVREIVGQRIARIDRVFYRADDGIEAGDGPLEITVDDGTVFLFEGAPDGETLVAHRAPWADPFDGALSPENQAYVAETGKWCRVPVSHEVLYRELVGGTVTAVEILTNERGRTAALAIESAPAMLWFIIRGDESHISWARPLGYIRFMRFCASAVGGNE
jgi:hypothetical protein